MPCCFSLSHRLKRKHGRTAWIVIMMQSFSMISLMSTSNNGSTPGMISMRRWRMIDVRDDGEDVQHEGYCWLTEREQNTGSAQNGLQLPFSVTRSLLHFTFPLSGKDSEDSEDYDKKLIMFLPLPPPQLQLLSVPRQYAKNRPIIVWDEAKRTNGSSSPRRRRWNSFTSLVKWCATAQQDRGMQSGGALATPLPSHSGRAAAMERVGQIQKERRWIRRVQSLHRLMHRCDSARKDSRRNCEVSKRLSAITHFLVTSQPVMSATGSHDAPL